MLVFMNSHFQSNNTVTINLNDLESIVERIISRRERQPRKSIDSEINHKPVLSTKEVLSLLNISTHTLYNLREAGRLKPIKFGTKYMYRYSDVISILENND